MIGGVVRSRAGSVLVRGLRSSSASSHGARSLSSISAISANVSPGSSSEEQAMPRVIMVQKVLRNGTPCANSEEARAMLERDGQLGNITVLDADVKDFKSPGWSLAAQHNVDAAPFFVVEDGKSARLYTMYSRLKSEILDTDSLESELPPSSEAMKGIDIL